MGSDRMLLGLRIGDPDDEVLGAWLAKESLRDIYLTDDGDEAALLVDKAVAGCADDGVPEIQSLGRTAAAWRTEILDPHRTGASNGPTEGLTCAPRRSSAAAMALDASSTTGSASSSTRWWQLAQPVLATPDPNARSPLNRVEAPFPHSATQIAQGMLHLDRDR
jgi:Transposase